MKAVLMSIRHKWCEKIFNGEKTIEVRKTAPKLEAPFKVYVYETLGKPFECNEGAGAVIGEFLCDFVGEYISDFDPHNKLFFKYIFEHGNDCLTENELRVVDKGSPLFGWHITEPELYDEPKELGEFKKPDKPLHNIEQLDWHTVLIDGYKKGKPLTRPPQSWCYVEEVEEG